MYLLLGLEVTMAERTEWRIFASGKKGERYEIVVEQVGNHGNFYSRLLNDKKEQQGPIHGPFTSKYTAEQHIPDWDKHRDCKCSGAKIENVPPIKRTTLPHIVEEAKRIMEEKRRVQTKTNKGVKRAA